MTPEQMVAWLREFAGSLADTDLTTTEEDNILYEIANHIEATT